MTMADWVLTEWEDTLNALEDEPMIPDRPSRLGRKKMAIGNLR